MKDTKLQHANLKIAIIFLFMFLLEVNVIFSLFTLYTWKFGQNNWLLASNGEQVNFNVKIQSTLFCEMVENKWLLSKRVFPLHFFDSPAEEIFRSKLMDCHYSLESVDSSQHSSITIGSEGIMIFYFMNIYFFVPGHVSKSTI